MIRFHTNDELLKVLRHRISQSSSMEVAAEIGIAPSTLSDVVSGRRPVSVRIARWLLAKEVEPVRVLREIA